MRIALAIGLTALILGSSPTSLPSSCVPPHLFDIDMGFFAPLAITVGPSGNLFVSFADSRNIFVLSPEGEVLDRWGGRFGQLFESFGLATDQDENVYIAHTGFSRVEKYSSSGDPFYYLGDEYGLGGTADGEFDQPHDVALDQYGFFYVADTYNHRIQKFTLGGKFVDKWGQLGSTPGDFDTPVSVAIGPDNNLYVGEAGNHRIQVFSTDGTFLRTWGEEGTGDGQFRYLRGMSISNSGFIYVVDGQKVQVFFPDGRFCASWQTWGDGANQEFLIPWDVAVGADERIHVPDTPVGQIYVFEEKPVQIEAGTWGRVKATFR
jgi:DNA-binding beta-propeller fold protein YncE